MIFDCTPDVSHTDQPCEVIRYVIIENQEVGIVESFIDFMETKSETAESIGEMI